MQLYKQIQKHSININILDLAFIVLT